MMTFDQLKQGSIVTFFCERDLTMRIGIVVGEVFEGLEVLLMSTRSDHLEPAQQQENKVMFSTIYDSTTIYYISEKVNDYDERF